MTEQTSVSRQEFEELKAMLHATWATMGSVLVSQVGVGKTRQILDAAESQLRENLESNSFHLADDVLHYVREQARA